MCNRLLSSTYPNIFSKLDEEIDEVRFLVVVDQNFDDEDSDEFDAIDPEDYNYLIYVTERLQACLGEEGMRSLVKSIEVHKDVTLFFLSEMDLYGLQTELDEDAIATMVLTLAEECIG